VSEEELRQKQERKRAKQHEAWLKWYRSPKGEAYKQKRKTREALNEPTSPSPEQQ
jgi:hypothetical protein